MTTLLQKAFTEIQKLPEHLQDELAQQLLEDIEGELKTKPSNTKTQNGVAILCFGITG